LYLHCICTWPQAKCAYNMGSSMFDLGLDESSCGAAVF
jgi:hypothetical protein